MKCPICKEDGYKQWISPLGIGIEYPYKLSITEVCKNNHKFGIVEECSRDEWNLVLENKLRTSHCVTNLYQPDSLEEFNYMFGKYTMIGLIALIILLIIIKIN